MSSAESAPVDAEELRDAFDFLNVAEPSAHSAYISLDTGKIYRMSDSFELEDEELPEDFDSVEGFFRRKGAYRRFKDLLESRGKLERWHEFENAATERALLDWCEANDIRLVRG